MSKALLLELLSNDPQYIRKIAKHYIELGDFKFVELDLGLPANSIEEIFEECPEIADEFEDSLQTLTRKKLQREGSHKIFKIVDSLYKVLENNDTPEDGGPSVSDKVRAANTLAKLFDPPKQSKKDDKEADLDDLLRQLEDDRKKKLLKE